jgi:hypothetical protein
MGRTGISCRHLDFALQSPDARWRGWERGNGTQRLDPSPWGSYTAGRLQLRTLNALRANAELKYQNIALRNQKSLAFAAPTAQSGTPI